MFCQLNYIAPTLILAPLGRFELPQTRLRRPVLWFRWATGAWWTRKESNLHNTGYEPAALPIKLRVHFFLLTWRWEGDSNPQGCYTLQLSRLLLYHSAISPRFICRSIQYMIHVIPDHFTSLFLAERQRFELWRAFSDVTSFQNQASPPWGQLLLNSGAAHLWKSLNIFNNFLLCTGIWARNHYDLYGIFCSTQAV